MKRIYVAGPYTATDAELVQLNVDAALADGEWLDALPGVNAFVPHLYHWWDQRHPAGYERWMAKCLAEVDRSDALFRRPGGSPGATREERRIRELGRPVFTTKEEVIAWLSAT